MRFGTCDDEVINGVIARQWCAVLRVAIDASR